MKYEDIRAEACQANRMLPEANLVDMTFGNVGVFDKDKGVFAIKPSGVEYNKLSPRDMVVVDLTGAVVDGHLRPSSDTPTYVEIFKAFGVRAMVHTHSRAATSFAQARAPIPNFGTTHSDYFYGNIPVTRLMSKEEIEGEYEKNTGLLIVETFRTQGLSEREMQAVLVASHGPFVWGTSALKAVENAKALEFCADMALRTLTINPQAPQIQQDLMKKHFFRKHGKNAYYGQI